MNHAKKIFLTLLLLLLIAFKASAAADNTVLVVELRDGSATNFLLADKPKVTFTAEQMNIVSCAFSMEFDRADVKNFHFVNDDATSVEAPMEPNAKVEGNTLMLSGIDDGTAIVIYNTSGLPVKHAVAVGGNCTVSLDDIASGLYIVTFNNTTFKFLKK